MWNIVLGLVFIGGGASGQLALRGTNSSVGLMIVGGIMVAIGIYQTVKAKSESE